MADFTISEVRGDPSKIRLPPAGRDLLIIPTATFIASSQPLWTDLIASISWGVFTSLHFDAGLSRTDTSKSAVRSE